MIDLTSRDPEEVGPEHPDDLEFRMNLRDSIHPFVPGPGGRCAEPTRKFCYEHKVIDWHNACEAQEWSVLHPSDRHDIECHCWECSL